MALCEIPAVGQAWCRVLPALVGMGGRNRRGDRFSVNARHFSLNDAPLMLISGEFQFSRFPAPEYWEEELLKMKAGGINTIQCYLFWIYHEPERGQFNWSGACDLRQFAKLCAKHDLWLVPRIGPYVNAECRNGGMPDWLYSQPFEPRSNDAGYLAAVREWYRQVGIQLDGLMFRDGGPVLCIQLENEYQCCAIGWETARGPDPLIAFTGKGSAGGEHLLKLRDIAQECGLDAPFYTVTAWEGSPVPEGEFLPATGVYAYLGRCTVHAEMFLFLKRAERMNRLWAQPPLKGDYPLVNIELQGGNPVSYLDRQVAPAASTEAAALVQLACGCAFQGYYVYHGGTNALQGFAKTSRRDFPQSYDFQAPIGEFGEVRESCRRLKLLHLFAQAYERKLLPMAVALPKHMHGVSCLPESELKSLASNSTTPRYAARVGADGSGFLFLNNFQGHVEMHPMADLQFDVHLRSARVRVPHAGGFTLNPDVCCVMPLNLDIGEGIVIEYALAQPLTDIPGEGTIQHFFFAIEGIDPEYCFRASTVAAIEGQAGSRRDTGERTIVRPVPGAASSFTVRSKSGVAHVITTLTRHEAEHAWRGRAWGRNRLLISCDADVFFRPDAVEIVAMGQPRISVRVFPPVTQACLEPARIVTLARDSVALPAAGPVLTADSEDGCSSTMVFDLPQRDPAMRRVTIQENEIAWKGKQNFADRKCWLQFDANFFDGVSDVFLRIQYEGDVGQAYVDGKLVAEDFGCGLPWTIGLKRFAAAILTHGMVLIFYPLRKGEMENVSTPMTVQLAFVGQEHLLVKSVQCIPEYRVRL